jgi:hypothetical protein
VAEVKIRKVSVGRLAVTGGVRAHFGTLRRLQ